jgi:hypothetical protein
MRDQAKPYAGKPIVFQFQGGTRNGQSVGSDAEQRSLSEAVALLGLPHKGSGGHRFDIAQPSGSGCERNKVGRNTDSELLATFVYLQWL